MSDPRWFEYRQNNTAGVFREPAQHVIVLADSPEAADAIAESVGVYFDARPGDCISCCGYRWSRASEYDELTETTDPFLVSKWDFPELPIGSLNEVLVVANGARFTMRGFRVDDAERVI